MFNEIAKRIEKVNNQRLHMAILVSNVMKKSEIDFSIRCGMAAVVLDMLENDMIPEDTELSKMLTESVNTVAVEAEKLGHPDFLKRLNTVRIETKEYIDRVYTGDQILNGIDFGDLNLN